MKIKLSHWWLAALLIALAACTQPPNTARMDTAPAPPSGSVSNEALAPAPAQKPAPAPARADTSARLGTRWGEGLASEVTTIQATRVTPDRPDGTSVVYYDGKGGRAARNQADLLTLPLADGRIEFSVLDANGNKMPMQRQRGGQVHLTGSDGQRYELSFTNLGKVSYEIVATVDGLDVISGSPGKLSNDGYILHPGNTLNIEGFRKNQSEVAAFRFSSVNEAYASNTPAGDPKNTGVIGAAVFAVALNEADTVKRDRVRPDRARPARPDAFPGEPAGQSYAPSPTYKN